MKVEANVSEIPQFNPVRWHNDRKKAMVTSQPAIKSLIGYDYKLIAQLFWLPALNVAMVYYSSMLSIWGILLLAATAGAFCRIRFFNILHEVCHKTIHPAIDGKLRNFLLMVIQYPSVGSYYPYYRYFHVSHHSQLGLQSIQGARELAASLGPADGDILIPSAHYSQKLNDEDPTKTEFWWQKTALTRFFYYGFIAPTGNTVIPITVILRNFPSDIMSIVASVFRGSPIWNAKGSDLIFDRLVLISALVAVQLTLGWTSVFYIFMAQLFHRGFLFHPALAFWITVHVAHKQPDGKQQPTTSVYGWFMSFLCGGVNYHVEHHDFPNVPVSKLRALRDSSPESYMNLKWYSGALSVYKEILSPRGRDWSYCEQIASSEENAEQDPELVRLSS